MAWITVILLLVTTSVAYAWRPTKTSSTSISIDELALSTPTPIIRGILMSVQKSAGVISYSANRHLGTLQIRHTPSFRIGLLSQELQKAGFHVHF